MEIRTERVQLLAVEGVRSPCVGDYLGCEVDDLRASLEEATRAGFLGNLK